jgi:hypothetical protein
LPGTDTGTFITCQVASIDEESEKALVSAVDHRYDVSPFEVPLGCQCQPLDDTDMAIKSLHLKMAHVNFLARCGLFAEITVADGSCFTAAVGRHLNLTSQEVRYRTHQAARTFSSSRVQQLLLHQTDSWPEFLESLQSANAWWDNVQIQVMADCLACEVIIIQLNPRQVDRPDILRIRPTQPSGPSSATVVISYTFTEIEPLRVSDQSMYDSKMSGDRPTGHYEFVRFDEASLDHSLQQLHHLQPFHSSAAAADSQELHVSDCDLKSPQLSPPSKSSSLADELQHQAAEDSSLHPTVPVKLSQSLQREEQVDNVSSFSSHCQPSYSEIQLKSSSNCSESIEEVVNPPEQPFKSSQSLNECGLSWLIAAYDSESSDDDDHDQPPAAKKPKPNQFNQGIE